MSNSNTATKPDSKSLLNAKLIKLGKVSQSLQLCDFPALSVSKRFELIKNIQVSLFGSVKLATDSDNQKVCIKVSVKECMETHIAFTGPVVMENVRREATILRLLTQAPHEEGQKHICALVAELEDEQFHYLITEYAGEDLFATISALPPGLSRLTKFTEEQGRTYFRQLLSAVQFAHRNHIIHLDLSIENICLDPETDTLKVIDFGLACVHPHSPRLKQQQPQDTADTFLPELQFIESGNPNLSCFPLAPLISIEEQTKLVKEGKQKGIVAKPGKLGYFCPELYDCLPWDGYSNDCYSLGVCLYIMLVGCPAYKAPKKSDTWFSIIYSGRWVTAESKKQEVANETYGHLSEQAIDLINKMIKPQNERLTLHQILQHPWMNPTKPKQQADSFMSDSF